MTTTSQRRNSPTTTTIKLDGTTKARIQALATARDRTPHWLMQNAILQYIAREEKLEAFRQETIAAYEHYCATGLHVSQSEADAWLAKLEGGTDAELPACHA